MISLYESNITDILPDNVKTEPEVIALGYALQKQNQKLLQYARNINIMHQIDTVPINLVDLLAAEFQTQYYSTQLDESIRRNLVKNTMIWHMRAGTTSAVEELVNVVFGYGKVEEWFSYDGEPFHFKISVDTMLSSEKIVQFGKIIKKAKNIRSRMDGFNKFNQINNTVNFASGMMITKHVRIGGNNVY